jgi:hypothetical protein
MGQRAMTQDERDEEDHRFTMTLAGLAIALFLGVVSLNVIDRLAEISRHEDCLLQGRMNCERIELSIGR